MPTMQMVVGVAVLDGGRVLAARRRPGPARPGGWEFPGGKVEPGENPEAAAVREISEELGCVVEVTGWLDGQVPIGPPGTGMELLVATARLIEGDPVPHEHDAVRWWRRDRLEEVEWLRPDVPFASQLGRVEEC